jgi:hypothetical protein
MDRYDLVLAAIPLVALSPLAAGALWAALGTGARSVAVWPAAAVGPLGALGLVGHELWVAPPGDDS